MSSSPSSFSLRFFSSSSSSLLSASSAAASTFHSKDSFFSPKQPKFPSKKIFISPSINRDSVRTIKRTVEIANSITDRGGSPPGEPPTGVDGGGGGGEEDDDNKEEEEEFGPVMKFEDVIGEAEARGATLPSDMLDAAKSIGIRRLLLVRYLDLQASPWPLGVAMSSCSLLRNRMLADPSFLFKVGTEVVIDACCGTFAEIQKRGEDFWPEFELYAADLLVGVVVDIALVGLLAPYVRFGKPASSAGIFGGISRACASLPSRSVNKSEVDIPVPPLIKSAALWGVFLAVSSNTRYQIVNGLEQVVEASPVARRVPLVAMAFTVGVRFANNIYGGMQENKKLMANKLWLDDRSVVISYETSSGKAPISRHVIFLLCTGVVYRYVPGEMAHSDLPPDGPVTAQNNFPYFEAQFSGQLCDPRLSLVFLIWRCDLHCLV
ncbi:hypothetical protein IEQ34_001621 [Dendrobium chrysotoxum]|uniref:Uncharacterized protein n=1 Tax=Dendrobium chrysotoxum TaxID=161865 RepID=A0AAV7HR46_DENCH|nr:hypothetical protein IEQ34_001621 [Dendrobium chrysotoxum]